jgi:hypothetical protein
VQANVDFLNSKRVTLKDIDVTKAAILVSTRVKHQVLARQVRAILMENCGEDCIAWYAGIEGDALMDPARLEEVRTGLENARFAKTKQSFQKFLDPFSIVYGGMRVQVTHKQCSEAQVTNGIVGEVHSLHFPENTTFSLVTIDGKTFRLASKVPTYMMIKIPASTEIPGLGSELRPVWQVEKFSIPCKTSSGVTKELVTNIPFESAIVSTDHGVQGKTVTKQFDVVITDFNADWPQFPNPGDFYLYELCETHTDRALRGLVPSYLGGAAQAYSRPTVHARLALENLPFCSYYSRVRTASWSLPNNGGFVGPGLCLSRVQ